MKQFYLICLLIFVLAFSAKAQSIEIVCGSVCGSCDVPHPNNPPDSPNPATPGEFYTQVFNLYNNSSIYAPNIELIADRAYFNGSSIGLQNINYNQLTDVYFSIPSWECEEVQLDFSINPNESGYYKIYYKMYIGSEELSTLPDGDLWVDITVDVPDCSPPTNLNAPPPNVTSNSAQVTFTPATGANSTNIYWTPTGTSNWQNITVSGSPTILTGLISNTEYVVQAASNCGSNTSDYTSHVYFITTSSSGGGSCDEPNGLYTNDIGVSFVRLNWNSVSGVNVYNVRYRQTGGVWTYEDRNTTEYFIQNLISSHQYEWQVASYCSGEMSNWSVSDYFTTYCTSPNAFFSVSKDEVLIGEEFNLNDLSTNTPTSWNWSIEDGATSSYTVQDPTNVSCTSAGIKDIILSVTNDCGTDDASTTITVNSDYGNQPHDIAATRDPEHFNKKVGDPVDPFTGEYSLPFTLFSIRGMGSEHDFTISYNSLIDTKTDIGWNWQHNYHYELDDSGDLWTITDGTGKQQFFVPYGNTSLPLYANEKDVMYKDGSLYILERTSGNKIIFTSSYVLQKITDRNGNGITATYNSSSQLTRLTFPGGRYLLLYYTNNLLTRIADKANRNVYITYNANDELEKITNVDGNEFTFYYNTQHQITSIKDAKGNFPVTNVYNSDNKVELQTDAENNIIEFAYNNPITNATRITSSEGNYSYYYHNSHGELTKHIDEEGYEINYAINDLGKPSRIINAMSDTVWLTYDSDENLTSIETPTHSATSLEYGDFRLPTKITDPLGNNSIIAYDANGNRQQQNLANGSIITESVDEYGRMISTQHQSQKTAFGYNPVNWGGDLTTIYDDDNNDYYLERITKTGFIEKVYDRNNNNIEYSYNNAGLVTNVEYDDYSTEKYKYDGNYNLEYFVNRNGDTTHYEWYKNDLLKSVTNALGQTTSIEYYLTTYPKKYTYPDGRTDVLTYFKNGWLKSITDDIGTVSYTYQANGEIATVTDRMNRISSMAYDKDGRLTSITNPLGQVNQLTYNDRDLVSATNAAGDATTYEYGNMGQFTKAIDPLDKFNLMNYDDLLNLTNVTDANSHQTTIAYNNRSLPTSITLPTNDVFSTIYDNEALVKTFTDANGITATIYRNSNNQVKDIYYSNSEWSGLQYYPNGQLKKIQNNNSEQNFLYDKIGQLTEETGAFSETMQYVYDPITNYLTQVIYPGNKTITYSYNKGLLSEVQDWNGNWAKYEYTNSAALQKVTYSNGIITNYTLDDLDQVAEQISYKGSDTICYYNLTRNSRNLIVQIIEKQPIMPAFSYKSATTTFDEADRPQSGGGSIFTNDANGNLLSFIDDTDTIGYSYAENNRITQSSYNGETITREYNAHRKPVKLTKNGIETRYTFSNGLGLSKPIQQRDGSNTVTQHYIYGADGLSWMVDSDDNAHFYQADYIGNIIALTNNAGAITDSLANDPWGSSVANTGNTEQPFGYMGKYGVIHLGNTQYIVGARDYIGALGRFVSADEYPANLANTQSNQRYSMAYNSPYNFVDPSGYLPKFATGGQEQSQVKQPAQKIQLITNNFNWKKALWDSFVENATDPEVLIDGVHNGLDGAGLVPGLGEIADGINTGIYALEGDYTNAGLSASAMIPFAGWGSIGVKYGRKTINASIETINTLKITKNGELTNGIYTVSNEAMKKHVFGGIEGRSIFYPTLNANEAVLKAAQLADNARLWKGTKAKIQVINSNIGTLGNGKPTNVINIYRNKRGYIHGSPGGFIR